MTLNELTEAATRTITVSRSFADLKAACSRGGYVPTIRVDGETPLRQVLATHLRRKLTEAGIKVYPEFSEAEPVVEVVRGKAWSAGGRQGVYAAKAGATKGHRWNASAKRWNATPTKIGYTPEAE